jgi:hypothetical protein
MTTGTDTDTALARWAVDAYLERYVAWRAECHAVQEAYQRWGESGRGEGRLAYAGYLAALDREERAARTYADHIGRVRHLLGVPAPQSA